jgi:hypothetical protein
LELTNKINLRNSSTPPPPPDPLADDDDRDKFVTVGLAWKSCTGDLDGEFVLFEGNSLRLSLSEDGGDGWWYTSCASGGS